MDQKGEKDVANRIGKLTASKMLNRQYFFLINFADTVELFKEKIDWNENEKLIQFLKKLSQLNIYLLNIKILAKWKID
jgi:hypothetical protein